MIEVGRLCMKIAGRDAGKQCVIVEVIDDNYVTIDGCTRRRKCNIRHIEPMDKLLKIKQGASHADIVKEFDKLGLKAVDTKPKKTVPRPRKQRKVREVVEEKKEAKLKSTSKIEKKEEAPLEEPKVVEDKDTKSKSVPKTEKKEEPKVK